MPAPLLRATPASNQRERKGKKDDTVREIEERWRGIQQHTALSDENQWGNELKSIQRFNYGASENARHAHISSGIPSLSTYWARRRTCCFSWSIICLYVNTESWFFFFFHVYVGGGHVAQQLAYIFLPGWTDKLNSFLGMLMLTIQSVVCACNVRLCTCSACLSTKQGAMGWIKIQQKYSIISFSPLYLFVSFMSSTICSI